MVVITDSMAITETLPSSEGWQGSLLWDTQIRLEGLVGVRDRLNLHAEQGFLVAQLDRQA